MVVGVAVNEDRNLRLQYLAGWGLNYNHADVIYQDMLRYRTFPKGMFTGSGGRGESRNARA